jgi:hypothetical protein
MHPDIKIWIAILMMAAYVGNTNTRVIHGEYALTPMHHLNMYVHQLAKLSMSLGILFSSRSLVELHLILLLMTIACFVWFGGCFMAMWERENIPYTPSDLDRIQRPADKRSLDFFMLMIPLVLIDLYKLTKLF